MQTSRGDWDSKYMQPERRGGSRGCGIDSEDALLRTPLSGWPSGGGELLPRPRGSCYTARPARGGTGGAFTSSARRLCSYSGPWFPRLLSGPARPDPDVCQSELLPDSCRNV